jgi:hypothetical protein
MVLAYHIRLAGWRQECGLWFHVWLREDISVGYEVDNIIFCGKTSNAVLIHCTYLWSFICITNCRKSKRIETLVAGGNLRIYYFSSKERLQVMEDTQKLPSYCIDGRVRQCSKRAGVVL